MNSSPTDRTYNKTLLIVVFIIGAFVTILNQTLLVTALPHIMTDFQIGPDKAQWLTTAFMLTNGILIPITAFLIGRFTTRQLFITAISAFSLGTFIASISQSFEWLLIARIIQACGAGITMPLMQTVFLTIFPKEKRGSAMGLVGLVIAFAPAIGPTLSGWIVDSYSWRYLFYIVLPIALIDLLLSIFAMRNVTERNSRSLDSLSVVLSTVGFGGLLYGFSSAGSDGWGSKTVVISLIIGIVGIVLLVQRQFKITNPMLEFRVFKSGVFTLTTILGMITFATMIGTETLLPLYTQNLREISAFHSGLMLLPGAIVMGVMSPITGKIFDKVGAKYLGITGFLILTVTSIPFAMLKLETSLTLIIIIYALRMAGTAMVMMPLTTAGMNALPMHLISHGTAVNNTFRQIGASIGTALLITIYTNVATNGAESTIAESHVQGMAVAFLAATIVCFIGFLLSFRLKKKGFVTELHE